MLLSDEGCLKKRRGRQQVFRAATAPAPPLAPVWRGQCSGQCPRGCLWQQKPQKRHACFTCVV